MSDPKIAKLVPPTRSYQFRHLGNSTTISFDERNLYVRSEQGVASGTTTHLLHHLSPRIEEECWNEPDAITKIRISLLLLLAAIVVYFSDVQDAVPLLAPALALVWLIIFASNCRRAWPYEWLTIGDEYGRTVANIRAVDAEQPGGKAKLDAFITSLASAIEEARKNEYFQNR